MLDHTAVLTDLPESASAWQRSDHLNLCLSKVQEGACRLDLLGPQGRR
jgi:hypothetical protein